MIACLAHIRRKFYDARPQNYSSKSVPHKGVTLCNELFVLDKSLKDLSINERYDQRLKLVKTNLEGFFDWCESLTAHGKLGVALNYALNQKERMMIVLKDGRLVLSNNLAERGIKTLVMGRKYLDYLLTYLPNRQNTPLEAYLPWNPKVQMECR